VANPRSGAFGENLNIRLGAAISLDQGEEISVAIGKDRHEAHQTTTIPALI
jgi:hypothetical protein